MTPLNGGEFIDTVTQFDIVGLVETHCGPQEELSLDGYHIYQNHRPKTKAATRYFGGIAVCIRNSIRQGIKVLPTSSTEIMWLRLCKRFFNLPSDLFIAMVYISPNGTSYSSRREDIFEILETDLAKYTQLGICLLCGDFNARTGCESDYCLDADSHINYPQVIYKMCP